MKQELQAVWLRADARNGNQDAQEKLAREIFPQMGRFGELLRFASSPEIGLLKVRATEIEEAETYAEGASILTDGKGCNPYLKFRLQAINIDFVVPEGTATVPLECHHNLWRTTHHEGNRRGLISYFYADARLLNGNMVNKFPPYRMNKEKAFQGFVDWLLKRGEQLPQQRAKIEEVFQHSTSVSSRIGAFFSRKLG